MDVLRTPDEHFVDLPDFPFAPHYAEVPSGDGATEFVVLNGLTFGPIQLLRLTTE